MHYDRRYLLWALSYAAAGMALGIFMAASHNHGQLVTHAHILLVGFVVSLIYAVIHKLWLGSKPPKLARAQFVMHQAGALVMAVGLFLLYGRFVAEATLDPMLALASITVFAGVLTMFYMVHKSRV